MAKSVTSYYTVSEFCENPNWSKATQKNYYYAILHYARYLFPDKDPDKKNPDGVIDELNRHVRKNQDPAKDIGRYANYMKGKPPKTVGLYLTAVRSFYGLNGHIFNKQEMKRIVPKTGDAETKQGEMTTELLKKMVDASDIRSRVLIMMLASTACRIGELCSVKLEDVDMTKDPANIHLRKEYTKNGRERYVFLTDECKDVLKIWLDSERIKFLQASYQRNKGLNDQFRDKNRLPPEEDHRLLGLSTGGARQIWYNVISRVLDKGKIRPDAKTHIHPFSPHVVRKWWRITANQGLKNEDICHIIMGHWSNSLDYVYAKLGPVGLSKEFKKGQYALSILSSESVKEIHETVEKQSDRILAQDRLLEKMQKEMETLKRIIEFAETKNQ